MHGDIDSAGVVPQTSKFNRSFEGGGEAEAVQQQHNISKGVATRLSFSSCHILGNARRPPPIPSGIVKRARVLEEHCTSVQLAGSPMFDAPPRLKKPVCASGVLT